MMSLALLQSKIWRMAASPILLAVIVTPTFAEEINSENTANQAQTISSSVARAVFTSGIVDREPVDELTEMSNTSERIYFFTDLRGLAGQIVTHQWERDGKVMAEVKFKVGDGPRWRVYSSKNLLPTWTGEWTVTVIDDSGTSLNISTFTYVPAPTTPDETPETPASSDPM